MGHKLKDNTKGGANLAHATFKVKKFRRRETRPGLAPRKKNDGETPPGDTLISPAADAILNRHERA
jgi:hypothetical protein